MGCGCGGQTPPAGMRTPPAPVEVPATMRPAKPPAAPPPPTKGTTTSFSLTFDNGKRTERFGSRLEAEAARVRAGGYGVVT